MRLKYKLNKNEIIVFKSSNVRHGFWGSYTNSLIITNQNVILEKYGMFNNFKGIETYELSEINQVIQGKASNGEKQIEIYINGNVEEFALQTGDKNEMKVIITAINDHIKQKGNEYDYKYYQELLSDMKDEDRIIELKSKYVEEPEKTTNKTFSIAGEAAKNVIKSGNFSIMGVTKGIVKATGKKAIASGVVDKKRVNSLKEEFLGIENEIRREFGLQEKMTSADKKELKKLEDKKSQKAKEKEEKMQKNKTNNLQNVNEQLELLKKAKELLDAGILTQEEFDEKKKEIMNK